MAKILISHVSPTPNKLTGITTYSWKILEALLRYGKHDYVLATNLPVEALPDFLNAAGLPVLSRSLPSNETMMLLANRRDLPRLKRRIGAALIFHTQPTAMTGDMDDSVVVIHDLYRVTNPDLYNRIQRLQWCLFIARGFRRAGGIIAVSHATRQALVAAYPILADRTTVVYEAAPLGGEAMPRPIPQDEDPFILAVANITPNKNIGALFEALDILEARGARPRAVIVGRDEINVLPGLIARFPNVRVELKQGLSQRELAEHYRTASVFVNTSLVEGFCLPILEAQSGGTPVICADIPVLHEVAGYGALFVDPRSPEALAVALWSVLTDSAVAKDLQGRAYANNARFSWKKAALETEAVFDRLLTGRTM